MLGKLVTNVGGGLAAVLPVAAQFAGLGAAVAGVWLLLGSGAALVIGGVAVAGLGTAYEAGWL